MNVFVARAAGDALVVEHAETDDASAGHEELYVVLSGTVDFTVDGEEFAAPAGTLVHARPSARRTARARAAGDTILALAGTPGGAYRGSDWEARWTSEIAPLE